VLSAKENYILLGNPLLVNHFQLSKKKYIPAFKLQFLIGKYYTLRFFFCWIFVQLLTLDVFNSKIANYTNNKHKE